MWPIVVSPELELWGHIDLIFVSDFPCTSYMTLGNYLVFSFEKQDKLWGYWED